MSVIRLSNNEERLARMNPEEHKKFALRNSILNVKETRRIDQMMKCWNLRVRGYSVAKIAATLVVSQATVVRRLQEAKKMLETQLLKLDENDQETLANRLEYVFAESTEAWEKSKTTSITSLDDGKELVQTNPGDPRFLLTALESLKTKAKLMGVGDRQATNVTVNVNTQIAETVSQDERMREIATELASLGMLPSSITVEPEVLEEGE